MTRDRVTFMVVLLKECEQSYNSSRGIRSVTGPRTLPITYVKRADSELSVLESKLETQIVLVTADDMWKEVSLVTTFCAANQTI